jgi:hypothetical protein
MAEFDAKYATVKEMTAKPGIESTRILSTVSQAKLLLLQTGYLASDPAKVSSDLLLKARDLFEIDATLNLKSGNAKAFALAVRQLKVIYSRTQSILPPSEQMPLLLSLYLVYLLTLGRADEFGIELAIFRRLLPNNEFLNYADRTAGAVRDVSFARLSEIQGKQPSPLFQIFTANLVDSARIAYAKSLELSCRKLRLADVKALLNFAKEEEAKEFILANKWGLAEDGVTVQFPVREKGNAVIDKSARFVDLAIAISVHQ